MDNYLCGMKGFEGYVGIHLWDGQMVNDLIFALLLLLFMFFAIVFRTNHRLFLKMLRDVFFLRERNSLFEKPVGDERLFRSFMHFQALFLCSLGLFAIARRLGYLMSDSLALLRDEAAVLCSLRLGLHGSGKVSFLEDQLQCPAESVGGDALPAGLVAALCQ